eukprot:12803209-Alexandrium_andersonii.AAC.1
MRVGGRCGRPPDRRERVGSSSWLTHPRVWRVTHGLPDFRIGLKDNNAEGRRWPPALQGDRGQRGRHPPENSFPRGPQAET